MAVKPGLDVSGGRASFLPYIPSASLLLHCPLLALPLWHIPVLFFFFF